MKAIRLTLWATLTFSVVCQAQITDPGWFRATSPLPPLQSRDDAIAQLQGTSNRQYFSMGPYWNVPETPIAEAITPEIQALADGLQDDPERIFDYVHDHIKFVLYFGSKKGAQLTLLEKSGNDFDQCALLVALLRAAGYTALQYRFGWMELPYDDPYGYDYDLHHWWQLTLNNTNWTTTANYLNALVKVRGYPAAYCVTDGNTFVLQRLWVAVAVGATTYQLDPAFKISEPASTVPGFSLTSAMGGTGGSVSNALWSAADGTSTSNYASGLKEASVRSTLASDTANLLNYLQTNCPNAGVQETLGGWQIIAAYNPWDYSADLPFYVDDFGGAMPMLAWVNEPIDLMSTLTVSFGGTNCQWLVPQLQGQRLALTYDSSGLAQLWQDDTLMGQSSTTSADTNVVLAIAHPVGSWDIYNNLFVPNPTNLFNQVVTNSYQRTNATYALMYAFEPDWGWLQQRQNRLDAYLQQGLTNGSREVVSETLNVMGLNWMLQTAGAGQMLALQLGVLPQYVHRLGRMAQEFGRGYYVDAYMQVAGGYPSGGNGTPQMEQANTHFDLWSLFSSGLEHGIIEQLQNSSLVGASTVKMLQIANTNGQAVYLANSGNWSSIQGSLLHYGSGVLNHIYDRYINQGYSVLMPANGSNHVAGAGSWAGYGYEARQTVSGVAADSQMVISGGFYGGYASDPAAVVNTPFTDQSALSQPQYYTSAPLLTPAPTGADPVDLADGTFQLESTDLSVGQAEPRGVSLTRYYNGTRRYSNGAGMAGGWAHNYVANAATVAAPQASLGGTTPAQAAPMLAATAAAVALYNGASPNPKNWTLTALIAKWGVDQLTKGGVSVSLGKDTVQFVLQPNGVYTPPANCTMTLSKASGAYSLKERQGRTFKFDTANRLASIVDPYTSVSSSVTYNASNWVNTVQDWKGRTLTFNYTGSPQQLTSVSDGVRTVYYGYSTAYNPQGDLVSVTDPENQTSTYVYDTNHQIIATLDALNRLVVSNIHDTQGHLTTQYTQGDTNKTWLIYWSGWLTKTIDPMGGERDYLYDDQNRLYSVIDELVEATHTWYDGQNHIIGTVSPLVEFTQFIYDGNHNLLQKIDPLGFTNQFLYDSQFNLIRSIDPLGNRSIFGYNAQFSLTGATNGAGGWVTYGYNTDGTLHTRTDSAGATTYGYDSYGQVNSITYPHSLGSESFGNNSLGDVTNHTNPRGFVTSFQYNSRRQPTNTVAPTNLTVKVAYDAIGNPQSTTDARGFTTTSFWSPTRHLTGIVFPGTPQGAPATTNIYDSRDWLWRALDPLQQATTITNDMAGRPISVTDPVLRTTLFGYDADGRKTNTTNAAQETTFQQWDPRGQLTNWVDPASHTVQRSYDAAGNLNALFNRRGKEWVFWRDGANRLTNLITPNCLDTWQVWNDRGLLAAVRDPAQHWTTNLYDSRGRLTNVTDAAGVRRYRFDANNNLTSITNVGRASRLSWGYDAYDRMSAFTNADGYAIQYRYDANGNVSSLIYPGSRTVTYLYDSLNRLTNVTDWSGRQTALTYDLASRLTTIIRPNNTIRVLNYDAAGETTNIMEMTATGFPIAFFTLGWGNSGRVAWEFAAPLPHSNAPPARSMGYYDDNQLWSVNGLYVANDANGNLTGGPLTNATMDMYYGYNARNQLTNGGNLYYAYDPAGNRVAITNGAAVTRLVVNPNARLSQVLMRVTGGTTSYYIYGQGLLYEIRETASSTNTLTYHYDYRGSTVALTDANGNVTDRIEYSAYGLTTYRAGTNDTPFLYNGRYGVMSDANGLLYMRARYYNPYICRFINADPSGFGGGLNFYCYADGNPISQLDPFGLDAWSVAGNFAEGVAIGAGVAIVVVVAAPVVVSAGAAAIVAGGGMLGATVSGATATTIAGAGVTGGLALTAGVGTYATVVNTSQNAGTASVTGNWDPVAYNVGTLAGGAIVGMGGGGMSLAESISGQPTKALPGLFGDRALGYDPNYLNGSIPSWLGSGPSPQSGAGLLIPAAAGAGLFLQPSSGSSSSSLSSSTGK